MKNAKILTGIASSSITAALSFALLACGDDSTSTSSEPVSGGNGSAAQDSSLLVKDSNLECIYENDEMPAADASSETDVVNALRPVATIYEPDEDGFAFVDMGYVSEFPCGSHYENLKASVFGDTLFVSGEFVDSYFDCICPMNVSFKVQNNSSFEKVSWISFSDRGTLPLVKENGVGEESSSSEEQGHSSNEEQSSSSVSSSSSFDFHMSSMTCCEDIIQRTDDVFGMCLDKNVDPMVDAALPPVAYMIPEEGTDSVAIVIENVSMACEAISGTTGMIRRPPIKQISVGTNYSYLNVVPKMDESRVQEDCICGARLIFKIEAKSNFISATTLNVVFDDNTINEIPIVKEDSTVVVDTIPFALDSVPESTPTELELNGYARGKCMDNDLAVKPVTKSAVSDLPEARQITYMNGMTVLTLENVMDYCGIDAKVSQKMVGDTLILDYYDQSAVTKCICNFDQIEFLLEPENTAARYVKFKDVVYWIDVIMYEVQFNWKG